MRAVVIVFMLGLVGCSGPCEQLADQACENAGEGSEACTWIRERASRASRDDKRACAVAVELVESLAKAR